jgi:hypothetical protein
MPLRKRTAFSTLKQVNPTGSMKRGNYKGTGRAKGRQGYGFMHHASCKDACSLTRGLRDLSLRTIWLLDLPRVGTSSKVCRLTAYPSLRCHRCHGCVHANLAAEPLFSRNAVGMGRLCICWTLHMKKKNQMNQQAHRKYILSKPQQNPPPVALGRYGLLY